MKGVVIRENGGPGVMKLQQLERPQRRGWLPKLKKGESAYPGIECSGEIIAVGAGVTQWKVGDQVCALVNRGGYAEEVVVPSGQLLSVPRSVSLEDAASLPVVACSVWLALFQIGKLSAGQTLLVRDGCSDFGIFAIQIAKYKGAKVLVIGVVDIQMTNWEEKELTVNRVKRYVWPAIEKGQIKPVIYKNFPLSEAANAHKLMENGKFIGKILLLPDSFMS
ncbi:oxidoreductase [Forsythia ovata]|uniref:Oxidoreductase n=1 Tax=Forsythia ovata TaxID=205694 RepID=A0ABD1UAV5_9LAMI